MPLRILYAGTVDLAAHRGDTLRFLHLANALCNLGHRMDIVGLNEPAHAIHPAASIFSLPRSMVKGSTLINDIRLIWKLFLLTAQSHYDVFYQCGIPLANRMMHARKIPAILEINGSRLDELHLRGFSPFRLKVHQLRETETLKFASHYICITEGIRDKVVDQYQVKRWRCTVIPNAADTGLFHPLPQGQCQELLHLPSGKFHLGFVGVFQPWIDFKTLFEAVSILRNQGIPVYLSLVGDGSIEPQLRQMSQSLGLCDIVRFAGKQLHQNIPQWINAFDVCVAPFVKSRNEAIGLSPLKLFEYMACERPLLATSLAGISDAVIASQAGRLYEPENVASMAQELLWIFQNPNLGGSMGKRGRAYVLKNHSWSVVAEKIEKIIQQVRHPDDAR